VFVLLGLQQRVVVTALAEVVDVVVDAVVANLFRRRAQRVFVSTDEIGVLALFGFKDFYGLVGFEELRLELSNLGGWRWCKRIVREASGFSESDWFGLKAERLPYHCHCFPGANLCLGERRRHVWWHDSALSTTQSRDKQIHREFIRNVPLLLLRLW
jgi:hypothetical protein